MENKANIKAIFYQYKIYKFKLEKNHENIISLKSESKEKCIPDEMHTKWKKYIEAVDKILNLIPKESSYFLKKLYIDNSEKKDFHYSESTFYFKQKKAINDFLDYLRN
ncbi:MAG: hypothetical protein RSA87_01135 [Malacoplasma sp.]